MVAHQSLVIVASSHERNFSLKSLTDVPYAPGVYHRINNLHVVIYIGMASSLHDRLYQHYNDGDYNAYYFRWCQTRTRDEAKQLETIHIYKHDPSGNINKTNYHRRS